MQPAVTAPGGGGPPREKRAHHLGGRGLVAVVGGVVEVDVGNGDVARAVGLRGVRGESEPDAALVGARRREPAARRRLLQQRAARRGGGRRCERQQQERGAQRRGRGAARHPGRVGGERRCRGGACAGARRFSASVGPCWLRIRGRAAPRSGAPGGGGAGARTKFCAHFRATCRGARAGDEQAGASTKRNEETAGGGGGEGRKGGAGTLRGKGTGADVGVSVGARLRGGLL
jgi:hypothetical protein